MDAERDKGEVAKILYFEEVILPLRLYLIISKIRRTPFTNKKLLDIVHDANDQPNCDRVNNCDLRVSML